MSCLGTQPRGASQTHRGCPRAWGAGTAPRRGDLSRRGDAWWEPSTPRGLPVRARGRGSHASSLQMRVHCHPRRAPGKGSGCQRDPGEHLWVPSLAQWRPFPEVTGLPAAGRGTHLPGAMPRVQAGTAQLPGWGRGAPSPTGCRGCADGGCADRCSENTAACLEAQPDSSTETRSLHSTCPRNGTCHAGIHSICPSSSLFQNRHGPHADGMGHMTTSLLSTQRCLHFSVSSAASRLMRER